MTKEELSRYYYLSKEKDQIQSKIDEIRNSFIGSPKLNSMLELCLVHKKK